MKTIIYLILPILASCTWMQTHPQDVKEIESAAEAVAGDVLGEPGKIGVELVESVVNEAIKPAPSASPAK